MLHCYDGKADCSDVLYIFSVRMSVYHAFNAAKSQLLVYNGYPMYMYEITILQYGRVSPT